MDRAVREYLRQIGRRGGKRSRRALSRGDAQEMVLLREARRAFSRFRTSCFWSTDPELKMTMTDVPWIIDNLRRFGDREAWGVAQKLKALLDACSTKGQLAETENRFEQ